MKNKKANSTKTSKKCSTCKRSKPLSSYFKVSENVSLDGRMQICSECIAEVYDVNKIDDVIALLRQVDRPFIQLVWDEQREKYKSEFSIGKYLRVVSSIKPYRLQTFADSDHLSSGNDQSIIDANQVDNIVTEDGENIEYSDQMVFEWGAGFTKLEYLRMEKLYRDSLMIYTITTPFDMDQLRSLVKLSILKDQALMKSDDTKFEKYQRASNDIIKNLGIRPVDRKGKDQQAGIKTFSQIFKTVERDGYVAPKAELINKDVEDIYDTMIVSMLNYYNRIVGQDLLEEVPSEEKEFYEGYFSDDCEGELSADEKADIQIKKADLAQQRETMTPSNEKVDENED